MNVVGLLGLKNPEWITELFKRLPYNCTLVTCDEKYVNDSFKSTYVYKDFTKDLHDKIIERQEEWLGVPFNTILSAYKKEYNRSNYVYIAHLVKFWRDYFTENKTNVFIGRLEAFPNDYVSMLVAEKMNIKFISFSYKFLNYVCFLDSQGHPILWKEPSPEQIEEGVNFFESHCGTAQQNINKINKKKSSFISKFSFITDLIEKLTMNRYRKLEASTWGNSFNKVIIGLFNKFFITEYISKKYFEKDFIYYVLHYKYETYMYREIPYEQYDILENVIKASPLSIDVYFRNHPAYRGSDANIDKIIDLVKYKNTKYIPFTVNAKEIINRSKLIVGIFSTGLLEAIILKKPSIVLFDKGYYVEGVNCYVNDYKQLNEKIKYMLTEFKIDNEKRKCYLGKLYIHLIPFTGETMYYGNAPVDKDFDLLAKNLKECLMDFV